MGPGELALAEDLFTYGVHNGEALGMIETRGLVAMIEASDAMVKAAKSRWWAGKKIGSGSSRRWCGDVAAVKAATDAGRLPRGGWDWFPYTVFPVSPELENTLHGKSAGKR